MPRQPRFDDALPIDPDLAPDDRGEPTVHPGSVGGREPRPGRARPAVLAAIAVGGSLGTLARAGLAVSFPTTAGAFPWTTFAINVTGSFMLGVVLVVLLECFGPSRLPRPFLVTGFLGGFTTFSTFMVEADQLGRTSQLPVAVAYVVASVLAGLFAAWFGIATGRRIPGRAGAVR